jgi:hypothetical protein
MRLRLAVYLVAFVLFALVISVAQLKKSPSGDLMARLSYGRGRMIDWRYEKGYPQVCFAAYRSGYYRISRLTEQGRQNLEGVLSKDQLAELDRLLKNVHFESEGGGFQSLQGAESLVAEVVRHGESTRYVWVNPENRNPLPKSGKDVVEWLENFQAQGATPFTLHELSNVPVCPPVNARPVQPVIAGLGHGSSSIAWEHKSPNPWNS